MASFEIGDIVRPSSLSSSSHFHMKHQSLGIIVSIREFDGEYAYGLFILYKNPFTFTPRFDFSNDLYPIVRKYAFDLLLKYYNVHERTFDTRGIREATLTLGPAVKYYFPTSMILVSNVDEALAAMPVTETDDPPYVGIYGKKTNFNTSSKRKIMARTYQRDALKSIRNLMETIRSPQLQRVQGPRLTL